MISSGAMVARAPDLHSFAREGRVLFVSRETGGWLVLEGEELGFFQKLTRPALVAELMGRPEGTSAPWRLQILSRLYRHGLIHVNGQAFRDPHRLWSFSQTYPTFLCLHITEACNFRCRYCYARADTRQNAMPLDTARLIVERILHELPPRRVTIDFHGGEPMLAYDQMLTVIRHARAIARQVDKQVDFLFQTNGSLLTEERIRTLVSHQVKFGVSIDGPARFHDALRVGEGGAPTWERVWDGIKRSRKLGFEPGLLAVVHDPKAYVPIFELFTGAGFTGFRINYSSYIGRATEEMLFPQGRGEAFAHHYLEMVDVAYRYCLEHNQAVTIADLDGQIRNLISSERPFMCHRSPCGAGNSILGFGIDGGIHACEENASLGDLRLGSIFDHSISLKELVEKSPLLLSCYRRTTDTIPRCRMCAFKRFCNGGCTSKVFARHGDIMRETPMCRYYQIIYPELMWRIHDRPRMVELLGPRNERALRPVC